MKLVIFGCGNIAHRIAKSVKLVKEIELVGFASKDIEKAKQYSQTYDCKEYGDYEYFLNSDIDAVYVATYNPSHFEVIKQCLEHHKNVICEKPMVSTIEENNTLFDIAKENNVLLMEAMKAVFLPINVKIKEMLDNKVFGDIVDISASFCRNGSHNNSHWIQDPKTGGALRDLGSYCAGIMNYLMGVTPIIDKKTTNRLPDKADSIAAIELSYGETKGHLSASNSLDGSLDLVVMGTRGMIQVENFWKANIGYYILDGLEYKLEEELISDFYYELKHFNDLVDNHIIESPIMSREASNNILKVTE